MAWMNGCRCGRWKSGYDVLCAECSGENTRRSYDKRSQNLVACIRAAAIEEMRFNATWRRVRDARRP